MSDGPDFIAAFDQLLASATQIARLMGAYFKALVEQGFTRDEALHLVTAYQHQLFATAPADEEA